MSRIFDNKQKVHIKVLQKRFFPVDKDALVQAYTIEANPDFPNSKKADYVSVESLILTDAQIDGLLANPTDATEQTYLTEYNDDRVKLRAEFQTIYDRLVAIQSMGQSTNEIVTNIKYLAEQMSFILRIVNKMQLLEE